MIRSRTWLILETRETENKLVTPKQNQAVLDYVAEHTSEGDLWAIIVRNQTALDWLQKTWPYVHADLSPYDKWARTRMSWQLGCPHCRVKKKKFCCARCAWGKGLRKVLNTGKRMYRPFCCTEIRFNGVDYKQVESAVEVKIGLGHGHIAVSIDTGSGLKPSYRRACAFLRGHVEWASAELKRRGGKP